MQRPEKTIALLLIPGVLVISLYIAISYLPLLTVRSIDVPYPAASVMRALLPMKGRSYLSASRNAAASEIATLPYIEDVSMRYEKGTLEVSPSFREGGIILASDRRAAVLFGSELFSVSLEDIPVLSGIYPVVGIDDAYLEYSMLRGLPESMLDTISHGLSAAGATSLITWMEYDNNSISGSPVLTMAIPDLNASLSIMDQSAAGRIEESLGIIRDEYIAAGSDAVFGETAHYGLYGDGLVRIERQ